MTKREQEKLNDMRNMAAARVMGSLEILLDHNLIKAPEDTLLKMKEGLKVYNEVTSKLINAE
jgi:hypothetical protein